jgi:uncharacterized protein (TIGR00730 family)
MTGQHERVRPNVSESDVLPTEHETEAELTKRSTLIDEIKETADKLARDNATRGDLKILSRALRELRYAFKVFTPYRRNRKVTVFGSARTPKDHPAFQQSVEFGQLMAAEKWMVLTGAGGGIMEGAHVGAGKEMSMGVNIMLPFEQDPNPVIFKDEKLVHLKYFFTRKLLFVKEVHAVALFPGGFGTQDEAWEVLTLVQTGKRDLMPIVCLDEPGGTYWTSWVEFIKDQLLSRELISPEDLSLFKVTDDPQEAVNEILRFYSVYNSMRYVRGQLVLRLHREPSDELLEQLNDEFRDIVGSGRIEKTTTHRLEADDAHLGDLPRLAFQFDRRSMGRLRQLVDRLNLALRDAPKHGT